MAGRVLTDDISWYVPQYTPSISNQKLMFGHKVSIIPTELSYNKRLSYMKDVTTENNWNFELGVGDGIDIPLYVTVVSCKEINLINNIRIIHFTDLE